MQLDEVNQAAAEGKEPAFGVHLDIASYGDMSSFFWAHSQPPPPGLVECDVAYGELPRCRGNHAAAESVLAGSGDSSQQCSGMQDPLAGKLS